MGSMIIATVTFVGMFGIAAAIGIISGIIETRGEQRNVKER